MSEIVFSSGFGEHTYLKLTFWEKWLVFWRLLKTKNLEEQYSIKEILEDDF